MPISRRGLLAGTAATGAGLAVPITSASTASAARSAVAAGEKIRPGDVRYADLVQRGQNKRFTAKPEYARVIQSTEDAVRAVQDAVRAGKRIAVRSGGHCFEDFVDSSEVQVLLDMSTYDDVSFDERYRAFSIGVGATLEKVYKDLFYGWGVTLPAGGCLGVGVGGHFAGGGYGPLSRKYGSVVDHLYGVEVVVVDKHGRARSVVATRDNAYQDLWWAHTGGGGGNFGLVTRYLMRSAGATGRDPSESLPKAPSELLSNLIVYDWKTIGKAGFVRAVRNFFDFFEANNGADSPYATLYSPFILSTASTGGFLMSNQMDASVPNAAGLLKKFTDAMIAGLDPAPQVYGGAAGPFMLTTIQRSIAAGPSTTRNKWKAGYLRKGYTDAQIETMHARLNDANNTAAETSILLIPYGGKVNTVEPDATATAQRDVMAKMVMTVSWNDAAEDAKHLAWARKTYADIYAGTGGVPVPNATNAGSYINYPDVDLADPAYNKSGVPWHDLYYLGNYPRLQQVKATWDPRNVFRHKLGIQPA
ncbi:FAD-binding protein [Kribbella sp. NPDC056345]|uniref:FAD-binding protein n=1 Tax=Kribbella sp. NPDC056345 TaxID=3345789 RepID=UPI0035DF2688